MYYWHWFKNIVHRPHTTGFPTELDARVQQMTNNGSVTMKSAVTTPGFPRRAAALRHIDGGSCNGCESELSLLGSPDYDFTRYGFSFAPSPKHADLIVITGVITQAMAPVIREVYDQLTSPKRVIAIGSCAINGGVFQNAPGVLGSLAGIVPVTVEISGCPPTPGDILRGLLWAVDGMDPLARTEERKA